MTATVTQLYRYPVKGLSPEGLDEVALEPERPVPGDRRFAIARGSCDVAATPSEWIPPENFVTLRRTPELARLRTRFDPDTGQLTIFRGDKRVTQGKVTEATGRMIVEQFLAAFLGGEVKRPPKVVDARSLSLTDSDDPEISLINLASVRDLERVVGRAVDPIRFRANIYFDGVPPWEELHWVGRTVCVGEVAFEITEPTVRCAATTVNPDTAERDVNIPKLLQRGYGHMNTGVYGIVRRGGTIRPGDSVQVDC